MKGFIKTDAIDGWIDKGNGITTVYMRNGMAATAYAEATVYQPELHKDAIDSVFQDFMEGASTAYDILTQNESGNDN